VISDAGWSKLDFAQRDKCKAVLEKPVISLYGTEWRERGYGFWSQGWTFVSLLIVVSISTVSLGRLSTYILIRF
jgi:hypothetical protein